MRMRVCTCARAFPFCSVDAVEAAAAAGVNAEDSSKAEMSDPSSHRPVREEELDMGLAAFM